MLVSARESTKRRKEMIDNGEYLRAGQWVYVERQGTGHRKVGRVKRCNNKRRSAHVIVHSLTYEHLDLRKSGWTMNVADKHYYDKLTLIPGRELARATDGVPA